MSRQQMQSKMTKSYTAAGGKNVGAIPWEILFVFLEKLLGGICPAKDVKTLTKDRPVYVAGRIKRELISQGTSRKEAGLIADAAVETINTTSVAALSAAAKK